MVHGKIKRPEKVRLQIIGPGDHTALQTPHEGTITPPPRKQTSLMNYLPGQQRRMEKSALQVSEKNFFS